MAVHSKEVFPGINGEKSLLESASIFSLFVPCDIHVVSAPPCFILHPHSTVSLLLFATEALYWSNLEFTVFLKE